MRILLFFLFSFFGLLSTLMANEVTIGTGSKKAMFYPVGSALCEVMNSQNYAYKCSALESKGAAANLQNLLAGKINFAVSQVSLLREYYDGDNRLRSVLQLHDESFTIVVQKDSEIEEFSDLLGKSVNIGNHGSGSRIFFDRIAEIKGWNYSDFREVYQEPSGSIPELFCGGKIDAAIYLVGHPNEIFSKIIGECGGKIISLSNQEINSFAKIANGFRKTNIGKDIYDGMDTDVQTIGVPIILSTLADESSDLVYNFVESIVGGKVEIAKINNILKVVDVRIPDQASGDAPLHEAVEIYLNESAMAHSYN